MAIKRRCPEVGLLHHSDQGCTYASEDYQKVLAERGIVCSMSRRGNPYDNAVMEAWNSTFKVECGERFLNNEVARNEAFDFIEVFYNQKRLHSAIGYVSPAEFEAMFTVRKAA
jgi:putative transposase